MHPTNFVTDCCQYYLQRKIGYVSRTESNYHNQNNSDDFSSCQRPIVDSKYEINSSRHQLATTRKHQNNQLILIVALAECSACQIPHIPPFCQADLETLFVSTNECPSRIHVRLLLTNLRLYKCILCGNE